MAETPSKSLALGSVAPDFTLPDAKSGKTMSLTEIKSDNATVIMFLCNHCPFVKHINQALVDLANNYIPKGVAFAGISSNDAMFYPDDSFENMRVSAWKLKYPFPYLYDESQKIAKAYDAACTPEFYVYDKDLKLAYHGQFDNSRPSNIHPPTGSDLRKALETLLSGGEPIIKQIPAVGCNIKWK